MTRPKRSAALLIAAILLAFATTAPAVTLMVNGDTPSIRWQSIVDRSHAPVVDGAVSLWLNVNACTPVSAGCALERTVWIDPGSSDPRGTLFHELGHLFDEAYLTDGDRAYYMRIWDPWPEAIADQPATWSDPWGAVDTSRDDYYGLPDEHFAEVYSMCAEIPTLRQLRSYAFNPSGWGAWAYAHLSHGDSRREFAQRVRHSCLFVRYVADARSGRESSQRYRGVR